MIRKLRLSLLFLAAFVAAGCSVYHPQAVNIPLVSHRGDAQVDLSAGLSTWVLPDVVTLNATASYGITDWLAAQAHANYGFENAYGQLALGAYRRLGSHGVVEGYLGFGYGGAWREGVSTSSDDADDQAAGVKKYDYSGHFLLPFLQGNIGWRDLTGAHIDLAFGFKVGSYRPDFDYRSYDSDGTLVASRSHPYTSPSLLLEPQLQFRIGGDHLKWNLRLGFAILPDFETSAHNLTYDWFTLSSGLTFFL